ncbi:uncharacterized protein LOC128545835 [Mercenaria mercenaria]|uniref:uncharacterized protein LOC128545835 n=1 Tax=Mercenaria mercenaria TaxID=6596 RepID=UPI00234F736A|nr:uncharacterized protein LOC128545835 [Mercenaria mercenaria]
MRSYFHVLWILCLMQLICTCQARKHLKKARDKIQKSHAEEDKLSARVSLSLNDVVHKICLPSGSNILVYRYQNDSHIFIGFDDVKQDRVYSMSWKINEGNPEALTSNSRNRFKALPASQVRKHVKTEHLLAAADENLQNKFRERITTCSQSRITTRACVIQSFAVLARKMKEVSFGETCNT